MEDWELTASMDGNNSERGGAGDNQSDQVPQALSEHQMLEHLVQQAQIVELKLHVGV